MFLKGPHFWKFFLAFVCLTFFLGKQSYSEDKNLTLKVLTVNGTEETKDKEIKQYLPEGLKREDIIDTAGLKLDYDINQGLYYVYGSLTMSAKESKEYDVIIKDIWKVDQEEVALIRAQIEEGVKTIEGTEFTDSAQIKKDTLNNRLEEILKRQTSENLSTQKRIDQYVSYKTEIRKIRSDAVSVYYWRSKLPKAEEIGTLKFMVQMKNPFEDGNKKVKPRHYLPEEVKPEHIVDFKGFDIRYDAQQSVYYLIKEVDLKPGEMVEEEIEILDVWTIQKSKIEGLRERARNAYKILKDTDHAQSAGYLVASIKENLDAIEESQATEKSIKEHISTYRVNEKRFDRARDDVEALESLLKVVLQDLERSILKNILQKLKSLKSIAEIAASLFKKPPLTTAWKVIIGIILFVGLFTMIHFAIWGKRSREAKMREKEEQKQQPKTTAKV